MAGLKQKGSEESNAGHVVFTQIRNGHYLARIDNVEVMLGNCGFEIVSYEERRYIPCDEGDVYVPGYHGGEESGLYPFKNSVAGTCPEGRDPGTCELINNCPFEETGNTWAGDSNFYGGLPSFDEVERMVRDVFNSRSQYKRRHERAACRFGQQPWAFDPPLPEWFKQGHGK